MENLLKALKAIKPKQQNDGLVPALKAPTVKPISVPSVSATAPAKIPGVAPTSNKDPKKMAEQLKNPRPKKPKLELLKFSDNGQWSLHKNNEDEMHYVIHVQGQPITKPMPLKDLVANHGSVKHIESSPHNKVVPVKKQPMLKEEAISGINIDDGEEET